MEVEGTPEEIGRLDIEQLLGRPLPRATGIVQVDDDPSTDGAENQLGAILESEAPPGKSRQLLSEFIETVQSWGDVTVVPSWRSNAPRRISYLRVHRHPRTHGAFVYIFPARLRLNFRLDADAAVSASHATAREVKPDNAYQVTISLADHASLEEARQLARMAYEKVGGSVPA